MYYDVARVERLCKLCHVEIEDEIHFVLKCRVYNDLRIMHLPEKFNKNPNVHKFNILMSTHSCDIIQSLAKYIHYALQRRSTIQNRYHRWCTTHLCLLCVVCIACHGPVA